MNGKVGCTYCTVLPILPHPMQHPCSHRLVAHAAQLHQSSSRIGFLFVQMTAGTALQKLLVS